MFNLFKKKKPSVNVRSCAEGILIPLEDVKDAVFASGAIGRGVAIRPTSGKIVSPVDGIIRMIFPTNHAVGIETEEGFEFIIHVGIDTVKLKGDGFKRIAQEGKTVKAGELLLEVDLEFLKDKGYDTDTMVILTTEEDKVEVIEATPYGEKVGGSDRPIFLCTPR